MTPHEQRHGPSRRAVLAGLALAGMGATLARPALAAPQPAIHPRSDWASAGPTGSLEAEDVRFLLIHHTESSNTYGPDSVARSLRGMYGYHTGEKNWPDIAYNFLVDRHGGIWEGRAGSLAGPVRGDATGGSQGFAQLCCFIGNHTSEPPTPAAQEAMIALLAWLAGRYGIDLHAGKTITFTSRGSNRWAAGAPVTTDPIAGHRDMSRTACPGDACYPLVRGALLTGAQARLGRPTPAATPVPSAAGPELVGPAPAATPGTGPATQAQPAPSTSAAPLVPTPAQDPTPAATAMAKAQPTLPAPTEPQSGVDPGLVGGVAAGVSALGGAAALAIGLNRRRAGRALEQDIIDGPAGPQQ